MSRVIYSVAMSLDGYIAGLNDEFDWIPIDPEVDFETFFKRFGAILMGRRSFEVLAREGSPMPSKPVYLFSRSFDGIDQPGVTLVDSVSKSYIDGLQKSYTKDLWLFGGGKLAGSFFQEGLVDSLEIALVPILLGQGIPVIQPVSFSPRGLTLIRGQTYSNGTVMLYYDVKK